MEKSKLIFYKSEIWIIILSTICLQMPDIKIGPIKIPEILMLILLPVYMIYIFKSKILTYFFLFFVLFFFKTAVFNYFTVFYINAGLPLLKLPYFISFSRLMEMMACLTLCVFTCNYLQNNKDPFCFIKKILFVQVFIFGFFYMFIYLLYIIHVLKSPTYDSLIVYNASMDDVSLRLKGFYVEGGPFGLFNAFLFTLCVSFYKRLSLSPLYLISPIILVLLAQSKAGYLLVLITIVMFLYVKFKTHLKNIILKTSLYVFSLGILVSLAVFVSNGYLYSMINIEDKAQTFSANELDPNIMLGRISASVIAPNMLDSNLLVGIGWGNYPLLRNNPNYRLFMPEIPVNLWDSTGFGGLIDMLIEGGLILFLIYLFLYYKTYKLLRLNIPKSGYIMLCFMGPLLLGVSIYFFYTWYVLGIILFFIKTPNEDSLREVSNNKTPSIIVI